MNSEKPLVIIVEDDDSVRQSLKLSLSILNYNVIEASNGEDGLKVIKKNKPDIIILDYILPKLNGIEILRQIRKNTLLNQIPVLMLSGSEDLGLEEEAIKEGFVDFMKKPFNFSQLEKALAILIRYRNQTDNASLKTKNLNKLIQNLSSKYKLTDREYEMVCLLYKGLNTDEILVQMEIKKNTHKNHMSSILRKMNVKNQLELLQVCHSIA